AHPALERPRWLQRRVPQRGAPLPVPAARRRRGRRPARSRRPHRRGRRAGQPRGAAGRSPGRRGAAAAGRAGPVRAARAAAGPRGRSGLRRAQHPTCRCALEPAPAGRPRRPAPGPRHPLQRAVLGQRQHAHRGGRARRPRPRAAVDRRAGPAGLCGQRAGPPLAGDGDRPARPVRRAPRGRLRHRRAPAAGGPARLPAAVLRRQRQPGRALSRAGPTTRLPAPEPLDLAGPVADPGHADRPARARAGHDRGLTRGTARRGRHLHRRGGAASRGQPAARRPRRSRRPRPSCPRGSPAALRHRTVRPRLGPRPHLGPRPPPAL
ncbi:MAG: Glycosyltransferase, partial [uncultured Friedmanniella sp.]